MKMPGFTAESTLYQTKNHYGSAANASFPGDKDRTINPQGCGWLKGIACGTYIAAGVAGCTVACLGGPAACAACWGGFASTLLYPLCKDCIPEWMRDLIDAFESDGGNGGGGGGHPHPRPIRCKVGEKCCIKDSAGNCTLCIRHNYSCP